MTKSVYAIREQLRQISLHICAVVSVFVIYPQDSIMSIDAIHKICATFYGPGY